MRIDPYQRVDGLPWTTTADELCARWGPPPRRGRNDVGLDELDWGHVVARFQDSGRLEEVTRRCRVLHLGAVAVPICTLAAFIDEHDADAFRRAGFLVSPKFGLAFVPGEAAPWVTALAAHCIETWRLL